jgi:hypothetical protein
MRGHGLRVLELAAVLKTPQGFRRIISPPSSHIGSIEPGP